MNKNIECEFIIGEVSNFDDRITEIQCFFKNKNVDIRRGNLYIYAVDRDHRMLLFDIMLHETVNLKDDWNTAYSLCRESYIMSDNIFSQLKKSPYNFNLKEYLKEMQSKIDVFSLMTKEEQDYFDSLNFPLTVYRGMCNAERDSQNFGISWAVDSQVAQNYVNFKKNNNASGKGKIASFSIKKDKIFAVWKSANEEAELIILETTPSSKILKLLSILKKIVTNFFNFSH